MRGLDTDRPLHLDFRFLHPRSQARQVGRPIAVAQRSISPRPESARTPFVRRAVVSGSARGSRASRDKSITMARDPIERLFTFARPPRQWALFREPRRRPLWRAAMRVHFSIAQLLAGELRRGGCIDRARVYIVFEC